MYTKPLSFLIRFLTEKLIESKAMLIIVTILSMVNPFSIWNYRY